MPNSVLVTGGTGGLGTAVTSIPLTGWRVVVPWVVREEVDHLPEHPHLHLVEADLFEHERTDDVEWRAAAGMKESQ